MHLASQYLAAAAISFLEKKADDSHTNLGFNILDSSLETHVLSEDGDQLCLNYKTFSLVWKSKKENTSFKLDGKSHYEILNWLKETSIKKLVKNYNYNFHYDLPYTIDNSFTYTIKSSKDLEELIKLRTLIQLSLEEINKIYNKKAAIRIWPHHFDTAIYNALLDNDISFGLGLAIPDNVYKDHYFYISGYRENVAIDTSSFKSLKNGIWKNEGFKGAILPQTNLKVNDVVLFFKEAINHYNP